MSWNKKIKMARERLGMGQTELANAVGLSPASITMWENGATKNIDGRNIQVASYQKRGE